MLESQPQAEHATGRYLRPDLSDGMSYAISSDCKSLQDLEQEFTD